MTQPVRAFRFIAPIALILALWLVPSLHRRAAQARSAYLVTQTQDVLRQRYESAFGQILGEVRATAADLMFVKTNRYYHAGIAYRVVPPEHEHHDEEHDAHHDEEHDDEHDEEHDASPSEPNSSDDGPTLSPSSPALLECEGGMPTVIRSAGEDFRGFLGDLERQVKPWRDASLDHTHTAKTELLPWYRVMTLANPQFIRAYRVGGMLLAQEGNWEEGLDFLKEGLRHNADNPELFILHQTIAAFHRMGHFRDTYPWPDQWLDLALPHALKGLELGLRHRPPGGVSDKPWNGILWDEYIEEEFFLEAQFVVQLLRMKAQATGDRALLQAALDKGHLILKLQPDRAPLIRLIEAIQAELNS